MATLIINDAMDIRMMLQLPCEDHLLSLCLVCVHHK